MAGNGIQLGFPFERTTPSPTDFYAKVADLTARDAIPPGIRYQGMTTYVLSDTKTYQLKTGITNSDWVEYGASSAIVIQTDEFSGNGSTTGFTLTSAPGGIDSLQVFIQGIRQYPTTDYTVSGTTLTFSTAPVTGTNNVLVQYGAPLSIGTPSDSSVTQVKMAGRSTIPGATAAVGEIALSASSGNFSTTSSTLVDVTNLSVTITTVGRPVRLELVQDGSGNISTVDIGANGNCQGRFAFVRDATTLTLDAKFAITATGYTFSQISFPPSVISYTDVVAAGTYTYKLQARDLSGISTVSVKLCKLMAYEI